MIIVLDWVTLESHSNCDEKTTVGEILQINMCYFGKIEKFRLNLMEQEVIILIIQVQPILT